jgi:hypothetical protein
MIKTDLEVLKSEIRRMHRNSPLYRLLRDELTAMGYWKKKPRGKPDKGYQVMRERMRDR